jgi:Tol biopolymer transport system component
MRKGTTYLPRSRFIVIAAGAIVLGSTALAKTFGDWGAPVSAEQGSHPELNTAFNDGCPILSPDGLSLYMATNRPGGLGGQDIWVAHRESTTSGWGAPVNLGAPVNSPQDDFCPTPVRGKRLFFVSRRAEPNGDIYVTRLGNGGWTDPVRLGPDVNSPAQEWSPSYFEDEAGNEVLYFGSTRPGGPGGQDIYFSVNFGPAQLAPGDLNTPFDDARPNVRKDGREIVFDSNRPGTLGGPDIYSASRMSSSDPWPSATHLAAISSPAPDTRASLSWDGTFMLFGSARANGEGQADVYVTARSKVTGNADAN